MSVVQIDLVLAIEQVCRSQAIFVLANLPEMRHLFPDGYLEKIRHHTAKSCLPNRTESGLK